MTSNSQLQEERDNYKYWTIFLSFLFIELFVYGVAVRGYVNQGKDLSACQEDLNLLKDKNPNTIINFLTNTQTPIINETIYFEQDNQIALMYNYYPLSKKYNKEGAK